MHIHTHTHTHTRTCVLTPHVNAHTHTHTHTHKKKKKIESASELLQNKQSHTHTHTHSHTHTQNKMTPSDSQLEIPMAGECKIGPRGYAVAVTMIAFMLAWGFSWGGLYCAVSSEVLPSCCRGVGMGLVEAANFIGFFVVSSVFEPLMKAVSPSGTFLIFSLTSLCALIFTYYSVPETAGMSLEEISNNFDLTNKHTHTHTQNTHTHTQNTHTHDTHTHDTHDDTIINTQK
eukprot:GHVR01017320.1.p1 GENE.GHVR01017320.1~~GHVR01017320.1.p1  ORF type:complete len:231 (-),score=159.39 GHVR01017320.1:345-1037(-)